MWKDPVKYSFAHGGKDGITHFVDRKSYDDIFNSNNLQLKVDIFVIERIVAIKKLSDYNSNIYSNGRKRGEFMIVNSILGQDPSHCSREQCYVFNVVKVQNPSQ